MSKEDKKLLIRYGILVAILLPLGIVTRFYFDLWYLNWMTGN